MEKREEAANERYKGMGVEELGRAHIVVKSLPGNSAEFKVLQQGV